MTVIIETTENSIKVSSSIYSWQWDRKTDLFCIYDERHQLISRGCHKPMVISNPSRVEHPGAQAVSFTVEENHVNILYSALNGETKLLVPWNFSERFMMLDPLQYETADRSDLVRVVYFARPGSVNGETYVPSLTGRYAVVPGLCMSTCISPVIDLQARLSTTAVLGSGAMRGSGLTQQWGLPAHYFCMFNTAEKWNAIGAAKRQSGAVCWGLRELPRGDERLEIRENGVSPVLNLRSDLWKHIKTPGRLEFGFSFLITFGPQYHEAIRQYYRILIDEKIIHPKTISEPKKSVLLSPQYNTWGVESASALNPEDLTEEILVDIYQKFRQSGMKAGTFVIDDKWEGHYGELAHDEKRFPQFEALLKKIHADGYFVGLWAAFLRCQNPGSLGLNETHLLQTVCGEPLWLEHQNARYGIFDVTQPAVQQILKERARQFIRRYQPDLIKFDFGYELPSLDVAAPADMNWAGERLLQKGLEIIVDAMKAENPDLVIMYYGLSPLLIDYYDLHSPDDLVYCGGDYDLETNRRIFFSSLCGELGMPTYGSSGYDWASTEDIWFDSAPSGTLGSLNSFDGDENGDKPRDEWIAKYNGLAAILRQTATFQVYPVEASWQGGLRAAFSPSWERIENGKTVLIALRTHKLDGKPALRGYKDIMDTDLGLVVASLTDHSIGETRRLGVVPFGNGKCVLKHNSPGQPEIQAKLAFHYLNGHKKESTVVCHNGCINLTFEQAVKGDILEWLEILFEVQGG